MMKYTKENENDTLLTKIQIVLLLNNLDKEVVGYMAKWKRDVLYGIAIIAVAAFASYEVRGMVVHGLSMVTRPDVYLWFWMALLALLAIYMIAKAIHKKDETKMEAIWTQEGVVTVIATFAYLLLMPLLGFTISSILFEMGLLFYYSWRMGKLKGDRKHVIRKVIILTVIAVVTTVATEQIFTGILSTRLPAGKIF